MQSLSTGQKPVVRIKLAWIQADHLAMLNHDPREGQPDLYGRERNSPDTSGEQIVYRCPECKGVGQSKHDYFTDCWFCAGCGEVLRDRFWAYPGLKAFDSTK